MPELAIVSTLALIAAPIVLVGGAMLMALARNVRGAGAGGAARTDAAGFARQRSSAF